jgi:hypothetical protein
MKIGDKIILIEDFTDSQGIKFFKDQTGVVAGKTIDDGLWIIEFDGYDYPILPWLGVIPENILKITES